MAKIVEYNAPRTRLDPSERGASAFDAAARRAAGLYGEAGRDYARIGRLQAEQLQLKRWPFDILALQQKRAAEAPTGGYNVRTQGGGPSGFGAGRMPNIANANLNGNVGYSPRYRGMGEIAAGADALGGIANSIANGGYIDPESGQWVEPRGMSKADRAWSAQEDWDIAHYGYITPGTQNRVFNTGIGAADIQRSRYTGEWSERGVPTADELNKLAGEREAYDVQREVVDLPYSSNVENSYSQPAFDSLLDNLSEQFRSNVPEGGGY